MSETDDPVLWSIDERGVARVTLNRPQVFNAYNGEMIAGLLKIYDTLAAKSLRAVVIAGKGRNFIAGADINWLDAVRRSPPQENLRASRMTADAVQRLSLLPVPTIALVQGACFGGGTGIVSACDIVIAADNARMSSPFARLGVALDSGGHYFLPRLVGYHRAMEMVYTSDIIRGKQAAAWGLVNRSVPGTRLRDRSLELARRIATGPVNAFMAEKAFMREAQTMSYDEVCAGEAKLQGSLMGWPEYGEGLAAFSAKRAPDFSGIPLRPDQGQP
jgi:methylglutaconyl-CoA hydratase